VLKVIEDIEALVPSVTSALARSRFGKDAVAKAEATVQRARLAIDARDGAQLLALEEQLERALQLFRGLVAGGPKEKGP